MLNECQNIAMGGVLPGTWRVSRISGRTDSEDNLVFIAHLSLGRSL